MILETVDERLVRDALDARSVLPCRARHRGIERVSSLVEGLRIDVGQLVPGGEVDDHGLYRREARLDIHRGQFFVVVR